MEEDKVLRILCSDTISKCAKNLGIKWLIGAPFLPCTVISSLNCVHTRHSDPFSPDFAAESDFLQEILPKGVEIVGALVINDNTGVDDVLKAVDLVSELRKHIVRKQSERGIIACSGKPKSIDSIQYFMCDNTQKPQLEAFTTVMHEEKPTQCFWDAACLLHCQVSLNLPVYLSSSVTLETQCSQLQQEFAQNLQNPKTVFQAEREDNDTKKHSQILRFKKIDLSGSYESVQILNTGGDISNKSSSFCSSLCSPLYLSVTSGVQIPKPINVTILQSSPSDIEAHAPTIEYYPAKEDIRFILLSLKLDVLCISSKESSLADSVSFLLIPALVKQFSSMCKYISHKMKQPKFRAYHFCPPGILHPVTVIYDLSLGETELNQVALREKIHACLNLPLDRPMVRVANALSLYVSQSVNNAQESSSRKKGNNLLTNVHLGLPSSGVGSGQVSLVQGSYEYYHYLQDDINDNGWGCAYRSLQTIISWFRLQQYSSVKVPSHREIQETLVEIGDKEATFIGSKEWIGAIELSFVLDKLLGVSCKIINVRSGAELPEKCRELSLHFETQGTPVMIGGGVLAYTLLGVDYNHLTGDCAFLILDPHYTGADDLRSIQNGGWCGWKKAVSSKGKEFFLRDKFYNLLLPQPPNMV